MKSILPFLLSILVPIVVFSQEQDSFEIRQCLSISKKARKLYNSYNDSSMYYNRIAVDCSQKLGLWEVTASNLLQLSLTEKDVHIRMDYVTRCFEVTNKHLDADYKYYSMIYNNMSSYHSEKADWDSSIIVLNKALETSKGKINELKRALFMQNIANAYERKGDYTQASNYMGRALQVLKGGIHKENVANKYVRVLGDMAFIKKNAGDVDNAIQLFEKSLDKQLNLEERYNIISRILAYHALAEIYTEQSNYKKSNLYLEKALALQKKEKPFRKAKSLALKANNILLQGKPSQALSYAQEAAEAVKNDVKGLKKQPGLASKSTLLGDVYAALEQPDKALEWYQKSITQISTDFEQPTPFQNPALEHILYLYESIEIIGKKADFLNAQYHKTQNTEWLKSAYESYLLLADILFRIRRGYGNEESKLLLVAKGNDIYGKAIKTAYDYYNLTQKKTVLSQVFQLIEQNKAGVLLESLQERTAKVSAGIPDSLLDKERSLLGEIYFYTKKIKSAKSNTKQSEKLGSWQQKAFELQEAHKALQETFKTDYPKYFALKYETEQIELAELQAGLKADEMILEYFVDKEQIFLIAITNHQVSLYKTPSSSNLKNDIAVLLKSIQTNPTIATINARDNYQEYTQSAHQLYTKLLAAALQEAPKNIKTLNIIPDAQLNYIPFEVLLEKKAPEKVSYSLDNLSYLLKSYTIHYNYSSILRDRLNKKKSPSHQYQFCGFAPSFRPSPHNYATRACEVDEIYALKCNKQEVQNISEALGGHPILGTEATKTHFSEIAPNSSIIHLATHACTDEANPMNSKIHLSNSDISNLDLFGMELNANLAVLSACNTGTGQLVEGEGVMSLSRGFFNAGVNSVLLSLWSVDDCTTSDLMLSFYKNLNQGQSIHDALRISKLEHLQNAEKLYKHPYYWAAFIQSGKTAPINKQNKHFILWIALLAAVMGAGYLFTYKNKS